MFRPLDRKRPLHISLKSSHAKGRLSLLSRKLEILKLIEKKAALYEVKIHGFQNMGNHIHLLVSFKDKKLIQKFLRVISGLIARLITGAKKGKAFGKRFWDHLLFTRIITGRRDFSSMAHYLSKNEIERECGQAMRQAMELHDEVSKEARRRNIPLHVVMEERLAKEQSQAR
jgi:REP element-mobilizing transposase RayT